MFKFRAISFPLLLGIFFAVIFWQSGGPWLFTLLAVLLTGAMTRDLCAMLEPIGVPTFRRSTVTVVALFFLTFCAMQIAQKQDWMGYWFMLAGLLLFAGWGGMLFAPDKKTYLRKTVGSIGVALMVLVPFFLVLWCYFNDQWQITLQGGQEIRRGAVSFMFLVLVTKSMDTGGYIAGMLSNRWLSGGNHKIVPSISPGKSYEGFVGGIVMSVLVAFLFYWNGALPLGKGAWWCFAAGVVLAVGSFAGDLTESAIKRACGVKDSGHYIPGMGGAFDVLDSFIYNGLLFTILMAVGS